MSKYGHRNINWFEAIVNKMGGEENAEKFLRGETVISEVFEKNLVIDCSAPVFCPNRSVVLPETEQLPNRVLGKFKFDSTKIMLYSDEGQKNGRIIAVEKLREALKDKKVLTAHVLDFLFKKENQHLIPEEWKGKCIFFWGTIYRSDGEHLYVRYLFWGNNKWNWKYHWLDFNWNGKCLVACV